MVSGKMNAARNVEKNSALLRKACPVVDLELVKGYADIDFLKMARKVRFLWSVVVKDRSSTDRTSGSAEDKL